MTTMSEARFRELADAFGGDLSKWPERERPAAMQLLGEAPRLNAVLSEESVFDIEIQALMAAPDNIEITPIFDVRAPSGISAQGLLSMLWPFGGIWQPAAGLVAASAAGFIFGMTFTDLPSDTVTAQNDQITIVERALGADVTEIDL